MPSDNVFYLTLLMILCGTFSIVGNVNQLISNYCKLNLAPSNDNILKKNTRICINLLHIIYLILTFAIPCLVLERIQESWILGNNACIFNRILIMLERSTKLWLILFITIFQYKDYLQLKQITEVGSTKQDFFTKFSLKISVYIMIFISGSLILVMVPNCGAFKMILQTFYIDAIKIDIKQIKCGISVSDFYFTIVYGYSFAIEFFIPGCICIAIIIRWLFIIKIDSNENEDVLRYTSIIKSIVFLLSLSFYIFLPHWCVLLLKLQGYDIFGSYITEYLIYILDELSNINISLSPALSWFPLMLLSNNLCNYENNETIHQNSIKSRNCSRIHSRSSLLNLNTQKKYRIRTNGV
uniref:G_PROTEIN_RECEP_F1_2 domain-containing protein n=1 Tax=Strongyloides papillosus TaxID=174720 RepID=A0A0N5BCT9_STREA